MFAKIVLSQINYVAEPLPQSFVVENLILDTNV